MWPQNPVPLSYISSLEMKIRVYIWMCILGWLLWQTRGLAKPKPFSTLCSPMSFPRQRVIKPKYLLSWPSLCLRWAMWYSSPWDVRNLLGKWFFFLMQGTGFREVTGALIPSLTWMWFLKPHPVTWATGMKTKEDARPKENAKTEKAWGLDDTMSWMQL